MALRELGGNFDYGDVCLWPEASVRCLTAIRPELRVKPTCQDSPTDPVDRTRPLAARLRCNAAAPGALAWPV